MSERAEGNSRDVCTRACNVQSDARALPDHQDIGHLRIVLFGLLVPAVRFVGGPSPRKPEPRLSAHLMHGDNPIADGSPRQRSGIAGRYGWGRNCGRNHAVLASTGVGRDNSTGLSYSATRVHACGKSNRHLMQSSEKLSCRCFLHRCAEINGHYRRCFHLISPKSAALDVGGHTPTLCRCCWTRNLGPLRQLQSGSSTVLPVLLLTPDADQVLSFSWSMSSSGAMHPG